MPEDAACMIECKGRALVAEGPEKANVNQLMIPFVIAGLPITRQYNEVLIQNNQYSTIPRNLHDKTVNHTEILSTCINIHLISSCMGWLVVKEWCNATDDSALCKKKLLLH